LAELYVFVPCVEIYLCNVNQQNAHLLNECFNSILCVLYMFRTLRVHHQEDNLYMQVVLVSAHRSTC